MLSWHVQFLCSSPWDWIWSIMFAWSFLTEMRVTIGAQNCSGFPVSGKVNLTPILTKWVRKAATADRLLYPLSVLFLKPSLYKPKKKSWCNSFIVKTVCFISYKIISIKKENPSEIKATPFCPQKKKKKKIMLSSCRHTFQEFLIILKKKWWFVITGFPGKH